jgi:hypothetical protein
MKFARLCTLSALLPLAIAAAPRSARACGGLFCSAASPVNQAAERIIFSFDRPQRKVTAVVEILYEGPAEKFAWVLPVRGVPEIGVSTSALLDRLQSVTNPTYAIQRTWGDRCGDNNRSSAGGGGSGGSFGGAPPGASPGPGNPNVSVLSSGSVGPYNYEVIKVEPADSDPAAVAITWLKANGYDVGALGPDVLRPYLRDGMNLVAFRLSKNRDAGAIRPVMLTYTDDEPMIPIRPTAVAANDDMGILVWVLGASRAVPTNYKTLEINEAVLDWFNPNAAYNDVVTAAADEAGGQGFVTELAAPTASNGVADNIFPERFAIDQFRRTADNLTPAELVVQVVQSFSGFSGGGFGGPFGSRMPGGQVALDGVADVLAKHLNLPAGVTVEQVLASPRCFFQQFRMPDNFYCDGKPLPPAAIDLTGFDRIRFLTDLEALVIAPLEKTVQLFRDQRYLTRLYTTMSARDMTLDPEFDLNPAMPDVSSTHTVTIKYLDACPGDTSGRWEATLESGQVVPGRDTSWPFSVAIRRMPVNRRVMQLSVTGAGRVLEDNTAKITSALAASAHKGGGGGCALAAPGQSVGTGLSLLLGAALGVASLLRARRRRS